MGGAHYKEEKANTWVQPVRRGYKMMCCDCGLVHVFDFRIKDGRVQFRVRRNERATSATRRKTRPAIKGVGSCHGGIAANR